jgi:hypothetical protein
MQPEGIGLLWNTCEAANGPVFSLNERRTIMKRKALILLLSPLLLMLLCSAVAEACTCPWQVSYYTFTCGLGLPCSYQQTASYCNGGGCRDCIDCAGSGQCNCGLQTYCTARCVPCGANPQAKALPELRTIATIAAPNCRKGIYEMMRPSPTLSSPLLPRDDLRSR